MSFLRPAGNHGNQDYGETVDYRDEGNYQNPDMYVRIYLDGRPQFFSTRSNRASINGRVRPGADTGMRKALIVLMGLTGVGKTSFINTVTGRGQVIENSLEPSTSEIREYSYDSQIVLVDTPGFDNPRKPDILLLEDFVHFLRRAACDSNESHLSGIIYLHRITDVRMHGSAVKTLRLLRDICGDNFLKNVTIVTTMWNNIDGDAGHIREKDLETNYWAEFLQAGAALYRDEEPAFGNRIIERYLRGGLLSMENVSAIEQDAVLYGKLLQETVAGRRELQEMHQKLTRSEQRLKKLKALQRDADGLDLNDVETQEEELEKERELLAKYQYQVTTTQAADSAPRPRPQDRRSRGPTANRNSLAEDSYPLSSSQEVPTSDQFSSQPHIQPPSPQSPSQQPLPETTSSEPSWRQRILRRQPAQEQRRMGELPGTYQNPNPPWDQHRSTYG